MRRIRRARRKRTRPKRRLVKSPGKVLPKITVIPTDRNARRFCSGYLNRAVAMQQPNDVASAIRHSHVFLGTGHEQNERKTWGVIVLCGIMMVVEMVGGSLFGSLALVADGLHMSTHAGAMLIAALAYTYARRHARDRRFVFGTGKLGDLAGFTSAVILAMIALLIGYEAIARILSPIPIHFREAIPIAVVGLLVNIASAWLLSGGDHQHGHRNGQGEHVDDHEDSTPIDTLDGVLMLSIVEDGVAPVFRLQ